MSLKFKVVQTPRAERFEEYINVLLTEGWELHGSPFIDGTGQMVQALLKDIPDAKKATTKVPK
jgi:hypothetical protein|tara:strand:+ start:9807 stop:9995 length:189 start_codon:yes stop_codon:yes gene_type:complete